MMITRLFTRLMICLTLLLAAPGCDREVENSKQQPEKKVADREAASATIDEAPTAQPPQDTADVGPQQPGRPAVHPTETVESAQKKILAQLGTIDSFSGQIDVAFASTYGDTWVKSHTTGTVEYLFEGDKVLYYFDLTIENTRFFDGEEKHTIEHQVLMSDGEYMYQIGEEDGRPAAIKATIDRLQTSIPSEQFFFLLHRDYDVTLMPDDQFEGKDVWVLHAAMKSTEEELIRTKTEIHLRKDIPVMVKTINYDRFDNIMQVTEIRDLQVNTPLNRDRFVFRPTPEMTVHDQTW